jgi:hypothetical protein
MTNPMHLFNYTGRTLVAAALLGAAGLVGCNESKLLTAPTPDVVLPQDISGPSSLGSAYVSAIGDFQVAYAGGYGNLLDNNEGLAQMTGLLSDELFNAETFTTRIEVDRRATNTINGTTLQTFQDAQRARALADLVSSRFHQFLPTDPRGAEVQALAAYMYVMFAEDYCNGVPTSKVNDDGSFSYGPPQTGAQLLTTAVAKFDSAITVATGAGVSGTAALNLARIGKARALLDLGNYAGAAAAVGGTTPVPSSYVYNIEHSENTGRQNNAIFSFNYLEGRFTEGDNEGGNGLPFVTLDDPRNPVIDWGAGFDQETEQFLPTKYPDRKAPVPLAIGAEARLIEAEVALKNNDIPQFVAKLNAARAAAPTYAVDLDPKSPARPSPAPLDLATVATMTPTQQQDLLFQERALTLYLTAHRVGDLRRLTYQYGRAINSVWPTGVYAPGTDKEATYGNDVNLPIPQEESNNPQFKPNACINRSAGMT